MDKKQLRTHIRNKRKALSSHEQKIASDHLFLQFLESNLYQSSQHFALYIAHQGELDLKRIQQWLDQHQKTCYLPVLSKDNDRMMHFVAIKPDEKLVPNQYGILEPNSLHPTIAPQDLDVVFVPLIAVDKKGFRLGAGKGYYDTMFAFKRENKLTKPLLIGIAYSWQQLDVIPVDDWDLQLDGLLTEKNFSTFK